MSDTAHSSIKSIRPNQSSFIKLWSFKSVRITTYVVVSGLTLLVLAAMTIRLSTPDNIAYPKAAHYHFRLQVIAEGNPVNFSQTKFQTSYNKDLCNNPLTVEPIHFHDAKDQLVHVHWDLITGGQALKHYGLNQLGGIDSVLGFRLDKLPQIAPVLIHGQAFNQLAADDHLFIYSGDETYHRARVTSDFLNQDLETFFGKKSQLKLDRDASEKSSVQIPNLLSLQTVEAHDGSNHNDAQVLGAITGQTSDQAELEKINDLIGNVVIFIQKQEPTANEVKARFEALAPLDPSTCGG